MLRLTGLPALSRYPEAVVGSEDGSIAIEFSGPGGRRRMVLPVEYVGTDDLEFSELELLAHLKRLGYAVRWRREPSDEECP